MELVYQSIRVKQVHAVTLTRFNTFRMQHNGLRFLSHGGSDEEKVDLGGSFTWLLVTDGR